MKSPRHDFNVILNSLAVYKDRQCAYCFRKFPETTLNIEKYRAGAELVCENQKVCLKLKKKFDLDKKKRLGGK